MEDIKNNTKICNRCKIEKLLDCFSKNQKRCRECQRICAHATRAKIGKEEFNKRQREYQKLYKLSNPEKAKAKRRRDAERRDKAKLKAYRKKHREKYAEYYKEYNIKNKDYLKKWYQDYYTKNKAAINEKNKARAKTDVEFRIKKCLRARIQGVLAGVNKSAGTMELLGCSPEEFKKYLESLFTEGMSWENHGSGTTKWHIGHIKHCSQFDLRIPEEQKKCFHFSNMRPEWGLENLSKNDILKSGKRARYTPKVLRSEDGLSKTVEELDLIS